jgi:hypothetical protein
VELGGGQEPVGQGDLGPGPVRTPYFQGWPLMLASWHTRINPTAADAHLEIQQQAVLSQGHATTAGGSWQPPGSDRSVVDRRPLSLPPDRMASLKLLSKHFAKQSC